MEKKKEVPSEAATWPRLVSGCEGGDEMRYCPSCAEVGRGR